LPGRSFRAKADEGDWGNLAEYVFSHSLFGIECSLVHGKGECLRGEILVGWIKGNRSDADY
jgi:hypothetical protein